MLLKTLMDDKQLNFNQPLLSVRRYSSTVVAEKDDEKSSNRFLPTLPRPPPYKSELKSGPVRNPGVVPFVWEQSPGKPMDERRHEIYRVDRPPTVPKLPPGRIPKANQQESDKCSEDTVDEIEEEKSDSGDESEVYLDALDTLSRTESFFLNCSVSGLDDQDVKPSAAFSTDPQARDFMMGRFLPAAKAMVSETQTPQYVPKKQPVTQDQPRQLKKVVNADMRPQLRYGPSFLQHYTQSQHNGEEEDSDDDYDESGNLPTKVCGLLPRFCLRSSFRLLNPVPGMSVRTRKTCSHSQRLEGTYPHRHFQSSGTGMSHCKNESSLSCEQRPVPGIASEERNSTPEDSSSLEKSYTSFRELLANQSNSEELNVGNPAVEKTLYIDTFSNPEYSHKKSCSSEGNELSDGIRKRDSEILKNEMEENFDKDSGHVEKLSISDEGVKLPNNFQKPGDFNLLSLADKLNQEKEKKSSKRFGQDEKLRLYEINSVNSEVPDKGATKGCRKPTPKTGKLESSQGMHSGFPAPPPLPKSPSDSWLCRALPSMNPKNSSHFATGMNPRHHQASKTQSTDTKWETIVKTTKVQQQHHLRYSEEILAPIPEN